MPHAVWLFLQIVRNWKGGAFHRNAGHVLQVMLQNNADAGEARGRERLRSSDSAVDPELVQADKSSESENLSQRL